MPSAESYRSPWWLKKELILRQKVKQEGFLPLRVSVFLSSGYGVWGRSDWGEMSSVGGSQLPALWDSHRT